ncbi:hypothetical protein Tco_0470548, partial [Tanacetum coccineum]
LGFWVRTPRKRASRLLLLDSWLLRAWYLPTLFSDDVPWAKGDTILFLSSIVPIRTSGLVRFVLLSTQFSVFVRDHVGRKVVVEERL